MLFVTWQALVVDSDVMGLIRCGTVEQHAALVEDVTARLVVTQQLQRRPVLRRAVFYRLRAVVTCLWRTARDVRLRARVGKLSIVSVVDNDGAIVGARQCDRLQVAAVSAVDI